MSLREGNSINKGTEVEMNLVNSQIGQDMLCRGEVREWLRVYWEIGLRERDESQLTAGLESQTEEL